MNVSRPVIRTQDPKAPHSGLKKVSSTDSLIESAAINAYESVITDVDQPGETEETRWLRHERLQHKSLHWLYRPSVVMIAIVVFLCTLPIAFGLASKISLLVQLICRTQAAHGSMSECSSSSVQVELSKLQIYTSFLGSTLSIFASSKLGQLSDQHGRKIVFTFAVFVSLLNFLVDLYLLRNSNYNYRRTYMILSELTDAFGGSPSTLLSLAYSYVIDVVEEEQRTFMMGIISGAMQVSMCVSPFLSSWLVKNFGVSEYMVLCICTVFSMIAFLFVAFVLPESRSERSRKKSRDDSRLLKEQRAALIAELEREPSLLGSIVESFKGFFIPIKMLWLPVTQSDGSKDYEPRITVLLLIFSDVLWNLATSAPMSCLLFYGTFKFDWSSVELGYFISTSGASRSVALILISPVLLRIIKRAYKIDLGSLDRVDLTTMRICVIMVFISTIAAALARSTAEFLGAYSLEGFSAMFIPALRTSVVKYTPPESTGSVLGALTAVQLLFASLGGPAFSALYSLTVEYNARIFFFVVMGLLTLCGTILFVLLGPVRHKIHGHFKYLALPTEP